MGDAPKIRKVILEERRIGGFRLGRHVEHDERSRSFPADTATHIHAIEHVRQGGPFNQGQLGSCPGNAVAGVLNTAPVWQPGDPLANEDVAVKIYELATTLDPFPGSYPPDDTGSSGLAACKAAKRLGLLTSYRHAFGIDHALGALMLHPEITGVPWYEGFDQPNAAGLVEIAGSIRGGHEFEVASFEPATTNDPILDGIVGAWQSWGEWGKGGRFYFTARTWAQLLEQQGDVTVPYRKI